MNWNFVLINAVINAVVVIVGWWIVHYTAARRDLKNKQREIKTGYLIDVDRRLFSALSAAFAGQELYTQSADLERALTDIQLLGNKAQVSEAVRLMDQLIAQKHSPSIQLNVEPLMTSLRDDLRAELGLDPITSSPRWIKISPPPRSD